ncbi:hypothetical protein KKG29_01250 [Patescibacteria group bacterium]|nr:hypothetical protein [Patescibacteria group bacterium]
MENIENNFEKEITREQVKELLEFIERKWDDLIYNSRGGAQEIGNDPDEILYLPNDYVVPNKERFSTMFYWDSYFIIQGLKTEGNRRELIKGIVDNCLYEVEKYSKVLNANKARWATRSQLPYLALMIKDVYPRTNIAGVKVISGKTKQDCLVKFSKDKKWLEQAFKTAKKEYNEYWMNRFHLTPTGLSRFYDESGNKAIGDYKKTHTYKSRAEASWDMSPRFDDEDIHDLLPVDLNCNLYQYENDFEKFAEILGKREEAARWRKKAVKRKGKINKMMWDEKDGLFFDYNFKIGKRKKIKSLASYQTMFVGLADGKQAEALKSNLKLFQTKGGLAACDRDYGCSDRQWNYPIIWAPLQYIAAKGLERYGYIKEAERVKKNFIALVCENWRKTGKIWEKYNGKTEETEAPFDRYPNQSGFGWTNAVMEAFIKEIYKI